MSADAFVQVIRGMGVLPEVQQPQSVGDSSLAQLAKFAFLAYRTGHFVQLLHRREGAVHEAGWRTGLIFGIHRLKCLTPVGSEEGHLRMLRRKSAQMGLSIADEPVSFLLWLTWIAVHFPNGSPNR